MTMTYLVTAVSTGNVGCSTPASTTPTSPTMSGYSSRVFTCTRSSSSQCSPRSAESGCTSSADGVRRVFRLHRRRHHYYHLFTLGTRPAFRRMANKQLDQISGLWPKFFDGERYDLLRLSPSTREVRSPRLTSSNNSTADSSIGPGFQWRSVKKRQNRVFDDVYVSVFQPPGW